MKNFFIYTFLFVAIFILPVSCQKDEMLSPKDVSGIQAQLASAPDLTKEEAQSFILENKLKKASTVEDDATLVEVFPLDQKVYEVYSDRAIKYFVYYEVDSNGYRQKMLTISQTYVLKDGKIDLNQYTLSYQINCPFNREFFVKDGEYLNQVIYFFRFDDGRQFVYISDRTNGGRVLLPPLANGHWQLGVTYDNGDISQQYNTELIDYFSESNVINIKFDLKKDNIITFLRLDNSMFVGAYMIKIIGEDLDGNENFLFYRVSLDSSLKTSFMSFGTPFNKITGLYICTVGGWYYYEIDPTWVVSLTAKG